MSTIFRLDSSIRAVGSQSRAVASTLEDAVREQVGQLDVIRRDVGVFPLPATAWAFATQALALGVHSAPKARGERTADETTAMALATDLADEMLAADAYLFAVPLYNYGVSQHAKAWIDLLITEPRFSVKVPSPIAGRPAYLVVARGGAYGPGTPREGWDHATPWLRRIFEDVWGLNLTLIEVELTLADVNPEMASLRDLAAASLGQAHAAARHAGEQLAKQWMASPAHASTPA
ncbi:flavodoxin family protein [Luteibacter pinisoli]|uniref:Flavodoxin family protein n=1 Tax=Luteibacter pinisoli TaxID=2589080 RepID=A0A4Y5YXU9_9GAMM|nr:NAD(P)H-dependent oxidoreductase [Luteibacter pinisoli]QDE37741.1 flavodoxin family protein [Luteibacter pinisoli]